MLSTLALIHVSGSTHAIAPLGLPSPSSRAHPRGRYGPIAYLKHSYGVLHPGPARSLRQLRHGSLRPKHLQDQYRSWMSFAIELLIAAADIAIALLMATSLPGPVPPIGGRPPLGRTIRAHKRPSRRRARTAVLSVTAVGLCKPFDQK